MQVYIDNVCRLHIVRGMNNAQLLNQLIELITPLLAAGILPKNAVRKLVNMGASQEMAEKVARLAEIEVAA